MPNSNTLYESEIFQATTGETLRPGGFCLTDRAVAICNFPSNSQLLDLGCGMGATVARLCGKYQLLAVGIDPSQKLLELARHENPGLHLIEGVGEKLPFSTNSLDGVFAECTLSLMSDLEQVLREVFRVLKPGGYFAVSDVYSRNPEGLKDFQNLRIDSCIRLALSRQQVIGLISGSGFNIVEWSDHTQLLKQLMVDLIMAHGSMHNFWLKSGTCSACDPEAAQAAIKQVKMGYYQLIAQKV